MRITTRLVSYPLSFGLAALWWTVFVILFIKDIIIDAIAATQNCWRWISPAVALAGCIWLAIRGSESVIGAKLLFTILITLVGAIGLILLQDESAE